MSTKKKARLLSPAISSSASQICVRFYYYMYGADNNNVLRVLAKTAGGEDEVWSRTGIQSPSWLEGSITVTKASSQSITVSFWSFSVTPFLAFLVLGDMLALDDPFSLINSSYGIQGPQ